MTARTDHKQRIPKYVPMNSGESFSESVRLCRVELSAKVLLTSLVGSVEFHWPEIVRLSAITAGVTLRKPAMMNASNPNVLRPLQVAPLKEN